jgi:broad specificity phosphatase PhoE
LRRQVNDRHNILITKAGLVVNTNFSDGIAIPSRFEYSSPVRLRLLFLNVGFNMKTIYFIRHAQSEANLNEILASRQDFALTEKGRQEAVVIASELKDIAQLDRIICSPLIRAQQTAQPIAETFGLDVETDERITEQDLGVFSGMTYAELEDRPDYMHERSKRWKWIPEGGGESYEMIANRLEPFFQSLESLEGDSILFVTHAVTLRMVKAILEQTLPDYPCEIAKNGEVWKVQFTGLGNIHEVESIFLGGSKAATSRV